MEPDGGFGRALGRTPGEDRLGFAGDESPVVGGDAGFLEDGKASLEEALLVARHVFGAKNGTPEGLELGDVGAKRGGRVVIVERDDIGLREGGALGMEEMALVFGKSGLVVGGERVGFVPDADGERLGGRGGAGPGEDFRHQARAGAGFGVVAVKAAVAGFVVKVPAKDARVLAVAFQDIGDVAFKGGPPGGIHEDGDGGALRPAGVVDARGGGGLGAGFGLGPVAGIEKNQHGPDAAAGAKAEEIVEPPEKAGGVGGPEQVVEEDAERVHAKAGGPVQLTDEDGAVPVVVGGLEHLELVDGGTGQEVAADEPGLGVVPGAGFGGGPLGGVIHGSDSFHSSLASWMR